MLFALAAPFVLSDVTLPSAPAALPCSIRIARTCDCRAGGRYAQDVHKASEQKLIFARTLRKRDGRLQLHGWGWSQRNIKGCLARPSASIAPSFIPSRKRGRRRPTTWEAGSSASFVAHPCLPACLPACHARVCAFTMAIYLLHKGVPWGCESLNLYVFPVRVRVRSSLSFDVLFLPFPSIDILSHPSLVCNFQPVFTDVLARNGRIRE